MMLTYHCSPRNPIAMSRNPLGVGSGTLKTETESPVLERRASMAAAAVAAEEEEEEGIVNKESLKSGRCGTRVYLTCSGISGPARSGALASN